MARLVRSPLAKRDIVEILTFTKRRWGTEQARIYGALIKEALVTVARDPTLGKPRDDVRSGLLAFHIRQQGRDARHLLFYVVADDGTVRVLRLLHDAMDFERHFP
jgi:toxin ParE1/3/4